MFATCSKKALKKNEHLQIFAVGIVERESSVI